MNTSLIPTERVFPTVLLVMVLAGLPACAPADQEINARQLERRMELQQRQWQRRALDQPPLPDPNRRLFQERLQDELERDITPPPAPPLTPRQSREESLEQLRRRQEYNARQLEAGEPYVRPRRPQPEFDLE